MSYDFDLDLTFDLENMAKTWFSYKKFQLLQFVQQQNNIHTHTMSIDKDYNLNPALRSKVIKGSFPVKIVKNIQKSYISTYYIAEWRHYHRCIVITWGLLGVHSFGVKGH